MGKKLSDCVDNLKKGAYKLFCLACALSVVFIALFVLSFFKMISGKGKIACTALVAVFAVCVCYKCVDEKE